MGKTTKVVEVSSNFPKARTDIQTALQEHGKIEVYAEGADIETAIAVSEFIVDQLKTANYIRIFSGLLEKGKIPFLQLELAVRQEPLGEEATSEPRYAKRFAEKESKGVENGKRNEADVREHKNKQHASFQKRTPYQNRFQ